jgi:hypothetical protein
MSKKVTIPTDGGNPFVVILGGIKYVYKPGETVDVPDGVALEIEEWKRWKDKYHGAVQPPFAAGGGGVQSDLSQNDPNAADYVKNRTHYEAEEIVNEPLNITWDGNTEGLVNANGAFYKVSDSALVDEQIKLITVTPSKYNTMIIADEWSSMVSRGFVTEDVVVSNYAAFVRKAGAKFDDLVFPEIGIYFYRDSKVYTKAITTSEPIACTKTVVKKIDKKFLPIDAHQTVLYYSSPDHWLYHDQSLTLGVSKDDLKKIINYRPIMLSDRLGENLYYPTKIGFLGSYAIAYVRGVSAEDEIRMYTSEYGGSEE